MGASGATTAASTRARMTRRRGPRARVVALSTLAVFLAVFALLVYQLRTGRDPAIGRGTVVARAPVPPPKRILVRKTIVKRVVVHLPQEEDDPRAAVGTRAPAAAVPAPATPVRSAPVVSARAPAPAPAAPPGPAPAPAP